MMMITTLLFLVSCVHICVVLQTISSRRTPAQMTAHYKSVYSLITWMASPLLLVENALSHFDATRPIAGSHLARCTRTLSHECSMVLLARGPAASGVARSLSGFPA